MLWHLHRSTSFSDPRKFNRKFKWVFIHTVSVTNCCRTYRSHDNNYTVTTAPDTFTAPAAATVGAVSRVWCLCSYSFLCPFMNVGYRCARIIFLVTVAPLAHVLTPKQKQTLKSFDTSLTWRVFTRKIRSVITVRLCQYHIEGFI